MSGKLGQTAGLLGGMTVRTICAAAFGVLICVTADAAELPALPHPIMTPGAVDLLRRSRSSATARRANRRHGVPARMDGQRRGLAAPGA